MLQGKKGNYQVYKSDPLHFNIQQTARWELGCLKDYDTLRHANRGTAYDKKGSQTLFLFSERQIRKCIGWLKETKSKRKKKGIEGEKTNNVAAMKKKE